ncbi:hypothetical protein [Azotobacter vinelandii]|uniref:hypothetical protein n=1 Tax=Azotobacter vinelandii TaxID=354 RepID=UPI0007736E35|nr:hypothetical protein [Azotobacter vinelandii]
MKRRIIFLAATAVTLTGCQQEDNPPRQSTASTESAETRARLSGESTELKAELARLQAADPTVKDIYYGVDEEGNKVLHVVRDQGNEQSGSSVWPLVGGMAAGALIGHMISAGGVGNYARHNPPAQVNSFYSREDERRRRNTVTAGYAGYVGQSQKKPSAGSPSSARPTTTLSTRSTGVFSSPSSARATSHSGGA